MDEIKYRLDRFCDALALLGEVAHTLADLAANPRLPDEQRRQLAAEVHDLADRIEELE